MDGGRNVKERPDSIKWFRPFAGSDFFAAHTARRVKLKDIKSGLSPCASVALMFEPRIGLKPLAALCRRLATSLGAGVDVRNVWAREASSALGPAKRRYSDVSHDVAAGSTISDSLQGTGNYFPEFFRELVKVGEETGHLPEVCRQLAEHYENQLRLRRTFVSAITWPVMELCMALGVVGILIYAFGAVPDLKKNNVDTLGFGLTGTEGLVTYLGFLAAVGTAGFLTVRAGMRGALWVAPIQRAVMRIPRLGRALETMAMARLCWAMHVTMNSGMAVRPAMRMSLRSTQNVIYTQHIPQVLQSVREGNELHASLRDTRAFPLDFLDAVQVGEESGQLVESLSHLAAHYQDEARLAMNTITILLGLAVWGLIAALIIFLIFRLFGPYLGAINDALNGRF